MASRSIQGLRFECAMLLTSCCQLAIAAALVMGVPLDARASAHELSQFPGAGRYSHSGVFDPSGRELYVFGGARPAAFGVDRLSDLWAYNFVSNTWREVGAESSSVDTPLPRFGASVVYDGSREKLLLFSGNAGDGLNACINDLWECDLRSGGWTRRNGATTFAGRTYAGAVIAGGARAYYTFGSCGDEAFGSIASVGLGGEDWLSHPVPSDVEERVNHVAVLDERRSRLLITSGNAPLRFLFPGQEIEWRKVWAYYPDREGWEALTDGVEGPVNLTFASGSYDRNADALLVFGGRKRESGVLSNELWSLDLGTNRWRRLSQPDSAFRRMAAVAAFCPCEGGLAVMGGRDLPFGSPSALADFRILPVQEKAEFEWRSQSISQRPARPSSGRLFGLDGWALPERAELVDCTSGRQMGVVRLSRGIASGAFTVQVSGWGHEAYEAARSGTLRLVGQGEGGRSFIATVPSPGRADFVTDAGASGLEHIRMSDSAGGFELVCTLRCNQRHTIRIVDVSGRHVLDESFSSGDKSNASGFVWNGRRSNGQIASPGAYFVIVRYPAGAARFSYFKLR